MSGVAKGQRIARSQAALLCAYAGRILTALVVTVVAGRSLSPEDFGFFLFVGTVFAVSAILLDLGTEGIVVREASREPAAEPRILEGTVAWRRTVGLGLGVLVAVMAALHPERDRSLVLAAAAIVLAAMGPTALNAVFILRQAQGAPAIAGICNQVLSMAAIVILATTGTPGAFFGAVIVGREAASILLISRLARPHLPTRLRPGLRGRGLGALVRPGLVYGAASLLYAITFHQDVFWVRLLRGETELGAYAAALRPVNTLMVMPGILVVPLFPALTAAALADRGAMAVLARTVTRVLMGIGLLGAVVAILLSPDLLRLLYGGEYLEGPTSAVNALRWLGPAFACACVSAACTATLLAAGREWTILRLRALAFAANLVAIVVLVPRLGFLGAAIATALSGAVFAGGALFALGLVLPRSEGAISWVAALAPPALCAAVLAVLPPGGARPVLGLMAACALALPLVFGGGLRRLRALAAVWHAERAQPGRPSTGG